MHKRNCEEVSQGVNKAIYALHDATTGILEMMHDMTNVTTVQ